MNDTDAELMRRAKLGDRTAFAELVRRYQPALRRVACSRLVAAEVAEDVVQETFLAAYKSRHTYDERFGFRTWLWTILLNQCRRYAGREARAPRVLSLHPASADAETVPQSEEPIDAQCTREEGPFAALLAQERRALLESSLAALSDVQADALRLRFFGGLKFQEIADAMQCSLGTAKNRVRWGLLRLATLVEPSAGSAPAKGARPASAGDTVGKTTLNIRESHP